MKLAIVGGGAVGLTLAAGLARVHDVVVLVRRADVAAAIQEHGIEIVRDDGGPSRAGSHDHGSDRSGDGDASESRARTVVRATVEARDLADRDALLVAVKAFATADALDPLRGVLRPGVLVASVQNGLDAAQAIRTALPDARAIGGSTTQGAIRLSDTSVRAINAGTTTFARSAGGVPSSDELVAAFHAAGLNAAVTDDIAQLLWRKLVVNAAINPLGALTGSTNGAVVDDPDLAPLARTLVTEAAAVARAEGVDIGEPWAFVQAAGRATSANRSSMLQDVDAGRRTEIDAISGAVVRGALAHGIDVPLTNTVLRLIRARERGTAR